MSGFVDQWGEAARTSLGLFWMAFWAFGFGYLISAMIQVFVTQDRMKRQMGEAGPKSVALATGFGFISSSCSFAALSTTRALFAKGAGLVPSLAFLLASTNLVIELGIVIAVFLSWQFVVGEYVGGFLLILLMWVLVRLTRPGELTDAAREKARQDTGEGDEDVPDWKKLIASREGWRRVAHRYFMEWRMVWKDVTIGFTVAGIISAFVPKSFFEALFVGSGGGAGSDLAVHEVLLQAVVGPVAAFFTFIGSMGNIPLAAVLYDNGISFAGIMAFIFSDLVVFPVLRIQAQYYGWKMALYIAGVFLAVLVASSLILHYGFSAAGLLPEATSGRSMGERAFFKFDYSLFLNMGFAVLSAVFVGWTAMTSDIGGGETSIGDRILQFLAGLSFVWLVGGMIARLAAG